MLLWTIPPMIPSTLQQVIWACLTSSPARWLFLSAAMQGRVGSHTAQPAGEGDFTAAVLSPRSGFLGLCRGTGEEGNVKGDSPQQSPFLETPTDRGSKGKKAQYSCPLAKLNIIKIQEACVFLLQFWWLLSISCIAVQQSIEKLCHYTGASCILVSAPPVVFYRQPVVNGLVWFLLQQHSNNVTTTIRRYTGLQSHLGHRKWIHFLCGYCGISLKYVCLHSSFK